MSIVVGIYRPGTAELNLYNMCKCTLEKAFAKHYHGKGGVNKVAHAMGISEKQVYSLLDEHQLRHLLNKDNNSRNGVR